MRVWVGQKLDSRIINTKSFASAAVLDPDVLPVGELQMHIKQRTVCQTLTCNELRPSMAAHWPACEA